MNIKNQWTDLIDKLDKNQVDILSKSLNNSFELAIKDASKEYECEIKKLNESDGFNQLHSLIIKWKSNYLTSNSTDYAILSRYNNGFFRPLKGNDSEKASQITLLFFNMFKKGVISKFEDFQKKISKDVYEFKKNQVLYDSAIHIIQNFNNNAKNQIKLPIIEKFEIDSFQILRKYIEKQKETFDGVLQHQKEIDELKLKLSTNFLEEKQNEFTDLRDKFSTLKTNLKTTEQENESLKEANEILINYNRKREPVYVSQFDNTVWGDNYPAIKTLHNFLLFNYNINCNWSFFAYIFTFESVDIINLNLKNINKGETGYLLFKIQDFFIQKTPKEYFEWLSKKITINNEKITTSFFNVRVRDTSNDISNNKNLKLIDKLYIDIRDRYVNT